MSKKKIQKPFSIEKWQKGDAKKQIAPEYNIFSDIAGSEEYEMHVVEVKTPKAIDDIITLRKVFVSRHKGNKNVDSDLACLKDAMNQNSTVLIGRRYESNSAANSFCGLDNFYIYGTCLSILNTIRKNFFLE